MLERVFLARFFDDLESVFDVFPDLAEPLTLGLADLSLNRFDKGRVSSSSLLLERLWLSFFTVARSLDFFLTGDFFLSRGAGELLSDLLPENSKEV